MGEHVPTNTSRASTSGFRLFAQFVLALINGEDNEGQYKQCASWAARAQASVPGADETEKGLMRVLLGERQAKEGFDESALLRLRHFLIEFGTRYVTQRARTDVMPSTMLAYVHGIQRRLREMGFNVALLTGPIFAHARDGFKAALDNKFRQQQARGALTKSHNVLTVDDVKQIFASDYCAPTTATGYRNRLIFAVGLAIGTRPTELWRLELRQFKQEVVDGKPGLVYYPVVGSSAGASKNAKGGIKAVNYRTRMIPIHDVAFFDGSLNVYRLIVGFLAARSEAGITCPRFFLGAKTGHQVRVCDYFRNQPLGRNTCLTVVKDVCTKLGIRGTGEAAYMTTHGLRATMISLLISAGYSDAAVVLRTGHRDNSSLQSYHNLRGQNGADQLAAVFGGADDKENEPPNTAVRARAVADLDASIDAKKPRRDGPASIEPVAAATGALAESFNASNCTINITVMRQ